MKELLKTIASIEAKISGVKSQAKQAFDLANAGGSIAPAEKLRIAEISNKIKHMQGRLTEIKGQFDLNLGKNNDAGKPDGSETIPTASISAPEPVYGYTKDEDARETYLATRASFDVDFGEAKKETSLSLPMDAFLQKIQSAIPQIDKLSKNSAFIAALDALRFAGNDLEEFLRLARDPSRKEWLYASASFAQRVAELGASPEPEFVALRRQAFTDRDSLFAQATSGKYLEALGSLQRLESSMASYTADLERFNADFLSYLSEIRRFETEVARMSAYPNPSRAMEILRIQVGDQLEVIYKYAAAKEFQNALTAITEGFTKLGELILQSDDTNRSDYLALLPSLDRWLMNTMNKSQGDLGDDFETISSKNSDMHDAANAGIYKDALALGWEIKALLEQLELSLSELKLYDEYGFRLHMLQPELDDALNAVEGEEHYTSVIPLRKNLQDLVEKGDEHVSKREYRLALDLAADIQDAMIQVTAEIASIETDPFEQQEITFRVGFQATAKSYGIDYFTFMAINHELVRKRGVNGMIEPGDQFIIPDPTLQIEEYNIDGTGVVLSKKDWAKLEAQLVKRALYRFDNHYVGYFKTLEAIYNEQLRNNDSFVGRCVAPYASTNPHKSYKNAKSTIEYTRKKIESESYNDMQDSIRYMVREINAFGSDLNKWRDELFGAAGNFVGALEFVRDGSIVVLATLATGPMTVGANFTRSAAINGLTSAGAGVVINLAEAATDVATDQKVDWGKVGLDISLDIAFDFISGAAVDRLLGAFKGIFRGNLSKDSSDLVVQWVVKDMMSSKGVLNLLVDVDRSIIADAVLDIAGGWVMSALFDGYWKEFQERIIMDVLRTDGKKDIDFKQFAEITAERVKSIAPEMYDGIFEAAVAQHGVENLVQK